jgi:hypothetical protein
MPSHRRRIRLTDRDAVYLAVATFILAITTAGSATATTPKPVELVPSVQPVPMTGHGLLPTSPGR